MRNWIKQTNEKNIETTNRKGERFGVGSWFLPTQKQTESMRSRLDWKQFREFARPKQIIKIFPGRAKGTLHVETKCGLMLTVKLNQIQRASTEEIIKEQTRYLFHPEEYAVASN